MHVEVATSIGGEVHRYANDVEGHTALVAALAGQPVALIAMEATGGYEAELACSLQVAGLPVAVINPRPEPETLRRPWDDWQRRIDSML